MPNVRAANDHDLWVGVGYAVAQDRLVQLELFRRATQGRLAEVLGESRLADDIAARRDYYTLPELRRMLAKLPAQLRARFDAYAEGVNLWLAKLEADPSQRPNEFVLLGLTPAPWRAVDSASVGVQLARTIPSDDGRELENLEALRKLGAKRFNRMLPLRRPDQVATIPASEGRYPSNSRTHAQGREVGFKRSQRFLKGLRLPKAAATSAALIRGGSDAWAVRGSGNRAWLFHGPQLGFQIPEQLAELEVHRPGLDAGGVTPPGLPLVGIGRNDHIAWGLTSGSTDDDDLYAERLAGKERYRFKGKARRMKCRTETFRVAGEQPVKRRLCRTVHGPVQATSRGTAWARRYATWNHEMDTLVGLAELNEADTVQQAGRALNKVSWNENAMVADDQGNIGWWHPGRLPIRPKRWDERLPLPGTGNAEWRGFLRPSQRPHVINPDQGWLANWNNVPSVGWTVGDAPHPERTIGRLQPRRLPEPAGGRRGGRAELRRDQGGRPPGRHDGAAAAAARRPAAHRGRRGERARQGPARHDPGLGRQLRPDRRRGHGRPGRGGVGGAQEGGGDAAAGRRRPMAGPARRLTSVRLRRGRGRGVPGADRRRTAAGGDERRQRARRPGHLASAAPDVRRHRARRRAEAGFEVL